MIDKKISIGTLLTIGTIIGTMIYTQGISDSKIESLDSKQVVHAKRIDNNAKSVVHLKIDVAKIETKIDEGFKRLEDLLMDKE